MVGAIETALAAPAGARFRSFALQVNPFQYVIDHAKKTAFADEAAHNAAMVAALLAENVEVIAVTDHYHVRHP